VTTPPLTRRQALAAAIQREPGPWGAHRAARAEADAGFAGHPSTARKDLRALAAAGLLAPVPGPGNRRYTTPERSMS
jgi:hypothetical protein